MRIPRPETPPPNGSVQINWPAIGQAQTYFTPNLDQTPDNNTPDKWMGTFVANGQGTTGMLYRRNRYFDANTGRFTQEDPIGIAGGVNVYGYAAGDPVNFSDPFGLCPPENTETWDCGSTYYADRIAKGKGLRIINEIAGVINQCNEDERCGSAMMLIVSEGMGRIGSGSIGLSTKQVGEEPLSVNQMNRQVQRRQAPRGIERVDVGKVKGEQDNVHFDDGRSLNRDGTWKHGGGDITRGQREWLKKNGWKIP